MCELRYEMHSWEAIADCADGTRIEKRFPYNEGGNYLAENERQYELECWLIEEAEKHGGCTFYTVNFIYE